MEFSSSYRDIMNNLTSSGFISEHSSLYIQSTGVYPVIVTFDIQQGKNVVPRTVLFNVADRLDTQRSVLLRKFVFPLNIDPIPKRCSSAEPILKFFGNLVSYRGRLGKVITSKGEVYYGRPGAIFDKDFNPLLFITTEIVLEGSRITAVTENVVHIHPKVFTDDVSVLNRNILKKGIPYILQTGQFRPEYEISAAPTRVVIDDSSKFILKPAPPGDNLNTEISSLLRANTNEVLNQILYAAT